jgi:general secretion pathway protein K
VNELYVVRGFNAKIIARLRPFVTTLPERTALNINTAPVEVLAAVLDNHANDAAALILARKSKPIQSRQDFIERFPTLIAQADDNSLDYSSRFFLAEGQAEYGVATVREQALLQRNGTGWPVVIWFKQM